jgi:hypothetical protein
MPKIVLIILTTLILSSCHYDYQLCNCNSKDEKIKLYNDILNELIEHHFYNLYLGTENKKIFNEYVSTSSDTAKIRRDLIRLQNSLYNDTVRFCNIYLDTVFRPAFNQWTYFQTDTGRYAKETKNLISTFSKDGQSVIDSLNSIQLSLKPSDFKLCTSKILSLRDFKSQKGKCSIGIVSFSKAFLDKTKTKGLLYCNFHCGKLCGKGELLVINYVNNRWMINKTILTWVS